MLAGKVSCAHVECEVAKRPVPVSANEQVSLTHRDCCGQPQ
jgi:hypothetical protein